MPTPTKTWKDKEAQAAELLNPGMGKRTPLSGINSRHNTHSDAIKMNGIYVEAKHRKGMQVLTLMKDTMLKAKAERRIPVLALTQHLMRGIALVIHSSSLDDFVRTMTANRMVRTFEPYCPRCTSGRFIEGVVRRQEGEHYKSYLARRCGDCDAFIPYVKRKVDLEAEGSLFASETSLPMFTKLDKDGFSLFPRGNSLQEAEEPVEQQA